MSGDVFLSVQGFAKNYPGVKAVDDISFNVMRGEVFGLLGPNGAGKTTTIRMLCGLLKADAGDAIFDGISLSTGYKRIKRLIGLCPQEIVLWEYLTCLEQLVFVGISYGLHNRDAGKRADQLLETLGLSDKRNRLAKTLSGGMQRRLNIALAIIHDPAIIILDEPQAGLDPQSRILVRDFIRQLSKEKTVILTTHDMDEADRLSDRVGIIDHGRLLMVDTPQGIKSQSGNGEILQIRIAETSDIKIKAALADMPQDYASAVFTDGCLLLSAPEVMPFFPNVSDVLNKNSIPIIEMTVRKRTLEDAFIALTGRGLRE
jgi:ABC-2 type transport system ATP-binding protein